MNNIKKIGLTALAGSLVTLGSAQAGEMSVSGGINTTLKFGKGGGNTTRSIGADKDVAFTGGGELDNGLTVAYSMQVDHGVPLDDHSVTVSSEDMGTLVFAGHGGSSATSSIDGSVAGDIWDGFDGAATVAVGVTGAAMKDSSPGDNSIFYTLPSVMDGLSVFASMNPQEGGVNETETGYGATYTGIEGLTVSYATTDIESGVTATSVSYTHLRAHETR